MDAFANDESMDSIYFQRALARLEKEREEILASRKREKLRPTMPDKLVFSELSFEEKRSLPHSLLNGPRFLKILRRSSGLYKIRQIQEKAAHGCN